MTAHSKDIEKQTNFDYIEFGDYLLKNGTKTKLSTHAGNSYCNNIYYYTLKNFPQTKTIFIHIPYIKQLEKIEDVAKIITLWINEKEKL